MPRYKPLDSHNGPPEGPLWTTGHPTMLRTTGYPATDHWKPRYRPLEAPLRTTGSLATDCWKHFYGPLLLFSGKKKTKKNVHLSGDKKLQFIMVSPGLQMLVSQVQVTTPSVILMQTLWLLILHCCFDLKDSTVTWIHTDFSASVHEENLN